MGHALRGGLALAAIVAVALLAAPGASAATKVNGHCGIHFGKGIQRHPPLNPIRYHATIGVKNGGSTGPLECKGLRAKGGRTSSGLITWQPFQFPNWNWHHVLSIAKDSTFTAAGCAGFATSVAAEGVSLGMSTVLLGIGGAACADGVYNLGQLLPGTKLNPKGVRLVK